MRSRPDEVPVVSAMLLFLSFDYFKVSEFNGLLIAARPALLNCAHTAD
jgi:hypothetical protein